VVVEGFMGFDDAWGAEYDLAKKLYTSETIQKRVPESGTGFAKLVMPIGPSDGYNTAMNPTHLGPYEIKSRLGRGGMGAVYEAVDTTTGDTVAVKVLASHMADDSGLRSRFESEIDALKNLRHPGIVRLLAFGEQDDQPFFAMELVRGKSLEQILRSGRRFTWRETVAMTLEITRALKVAHDHGIVHRDMKPANLLVADPVQGLAEHEPGPATEGGGSRAAVKLADFGIAKLFGGVAHTALGHVVGTAEYMAPEQATGRPVDHRADLYSLGLVMYAMLTGFPPFRGTQLTEVIDKQRRAIPPRVASIVPDVPAALDELIARLLSKDPAQRPASALALGRLLSAIETLHEPGDAAGASARPSANPAGTGPAPARDIARGPTSHDRSNRATRPVDAVGETGPANLPGDAVPRGGLPPAADRDVDLLAPTQPLPPPTARPQPRTVPVGNAVPRPTAGGGQRQTAGSTDVTQDFSGKGVVPRAAASASPSAHSRLPTDVASATTQVDRSLRNQFTTVAEFERATAERERRDRLWQLGWQGLTTVVLVASLAGIAWLLMRSPTADQIYDRIDAVATDEHGDLRDVRDAMDQFLEKHAGDPRAGRIRDLKRRLELDVLERRARRRSRSDQEFTPLERDYRAAMTNEEHGPTACVQSLEAMLAVHAKASPGGDAEDNLWLDLARRKLEQLRPQALAEQQDDAKRIGALLAEAASLAARAEIANDAAARKKFDTQRRAILANVVEVYSERPHAAQAVDFARRELGTPGQQPQSPAPATPSSGTN
jgi:serine/threonine protein kinase